jgi:hypothetical protein
MKSKLRTITIITYFFLLLIFGFVSISALFININYIIGIITGVIFSILIFIAIKYLSLIEICYMQNKIIFQKPLQFKKTELNFSEIMGYNFFVMTAKSNDYIGLKIITKKHFYYLSDFETKNLHQIESEIINHFKLCKKGSNEEENKEQKHIEITSRNEIKKNQKIQITSILKIFKFLSFFMVLMSILDFYIHETVNIGKILFFTISILFLVYTFYKSNRIKKHKNNY